jgi:nicotinate-nucleotide adenylyltransferase
VTRERNLAATAADHGPIGILGGTFDPVHLGHLRTAVEVIERCRLSSLRLMPCGMPPHRPPPVAGADLRLRMLRAALAGEPRLAVDERELQRPGPSYMVDSLASLRAEFGTRGLCLVLGADAFLGLPSWKRWREICDLAHLIVLRRPGCEIQVDGELRDLLAARASDDITALHRAAAGVIRIEPVTQLDISSSAIRALVAAGDDPRYLVPDAVRDIILSTGCYRNFAGPAAGSTEVQRRA